MFCEHDKYNAVCLVAITSRGFLAAADVGVYKKAPENETRARHTFSRAILFHGEYPRSNEAFFSRSVGRCFFFWYFSNRLNFFYAREYSALLRTRTDRNRKWVLQKGIREHRRRPMSPICPGRPGHQPIDGEYTTPMSIKLNTYVRLSDYLIYILYLCIKSRYHNC